MNERDDKPSEFFGLEETSAAWVAPPVLLARPVEGPLDWEAAVRRVFERFPKTLARLAE